MGRDEVGRHGLPCLGGGAGQGAWTAGATRLTDTVPGATGSRGLAPATVAFAVAQPSAVEPEILAEVVITMRPSPAPPSGAMG